MVGNGWYIGKEAKMGREEANVIPELGLLGNQHSTFHSGP